MNLRGKPFYLGDEEMQWVENTLRDMTEDDKIGQLFCIVARGGDEAHLRDMIAKVKPGGVMCRPMPLNDTLSTINTIHQASNIPMLIAANLESGGNGVVSEAVKIGSPMQIAATGNAEMAGKLGTACGEIGRAVGVNWAFAPIVDIDMNFRNPICNTRTFGSDVKTVKTMGLEYINAAQRLNIAACAKHFPGDGVDERDHHLVTSCNDLSVAEWDKTYGEIYKACINTGILSIMAGHIALPEYERAIDPNIKDKDIMPASLSKAVITGLLREKLGFNGLIVTDASTMAGMCISMPRSKAVPWAIACGCDMFLFTKNMDEDLHYMMEGFNDGILTEERLDEAVTRILAMKAALKLHIPKECVELNRESALKTINSPKHREWALECADRSITLVKCEENVLPLTPDRYKRILYYGIEAKQGYAYSVKSGVVAEFGKLLAKAGFLVDEYKPGAGHEGFQLSSSEITGKYDAIIYLANIATMSNQTTVRIEWEMPMGLNVPIYIESLPTVFISVENPYHLLDVPRVKTMINAYSSTAETLSSLVDKLTGKSEFKGSSPSDPFCGRWDART